ncbi:hypothetical protein MD484_g7731, partial [Candolleomyces efflorescens]
MATNPRPSKKLRNVLREVKELERSASRGEKEIEGLRMQLEEQKGNGIGGRRESTLKRKIAELEESADGMNEAAAGYRSTINRQKQEIKELTKIVREQEKRIERLEDKRRTWTELCSDVDDVARCRSCAKYMEVAHSYEHPFSSRTGH